VDSKGYLSHEAGADRAVGRAPDGSGGWALFDGLNPYTGSTPPIGTGWATLRISCPRVLRRRTVPAGAVAPQSK